MKNYQPLLANRNVQAFLALIRYTEGADYDTLFGGGTFSDFSRHPNKAITRNLGGHPITSTAAGAYQFLHRTWSECQASLNLPDFGVDSQDMAALFLIDRRHALADVLDGDWPAAIEACNHEWASLPGSPYGQPTKSMSKCMAFLAEHTTPLEFSFRKEAPAPVALVDRPKPEESHNVVTSFFQALKYGNVLANASTWKDTQNLANTLTGFLCAVLAISRYFGHDLGLSDAQVVSLVSGGVVLVSLFNQAATTVSSAKVGVRNVPNAGGSNGSDQGPVSEQSKPFDADAFGAGNRG